MIFNLVSAEELWQPMGVRSHNLLALLAGLCLLNAVLADEGKHIVSLKLLTDLVGFDFHPQGTILETDA